MCVLCVRAYAHDSVILSKSILLELILRYRPKKLCFDLSLYGIQFNGSFNCSSLVVVDGSCMYFFPPLVKGGGEEKYDGKRHKLDQLEIRGVYSFVKNDFFINTLDRIIVDCLWRGVIIKIVL